jgi:hypothetical protein
MSAISFNAGEPSLSSNREAYSKPGLYCVHCTRNDFVLFGESDNVFEAIEDTYYVLLYRLDPNKKLLHDFNEYGEPWFDFSILQHGKEFEDLIFRKKA